MKKCLLALLALPFLAYGLLKFSGLPHIQLLGDLVSRVDTQRPVVALTFDDGPTPAWTDSILQELAHHDVRATFFLVGEAMARSPELTRRIARAGHEIGNHSYTHQRMLLRSPDFVREELDRTDALIREAGVAGPIHFRPPYGKRLLTLPLELRRRGTTTITWDVDPVSGLGGRADGAAMADYILERARPGSIVLLHVMFDARSAEREAVPLVIQGLRERGYEFVTISELMNER